MSELSCAVPLPPRRRLLPGGLDDSVRPRRTRTCSNAAAWRRFVYRLRDRRTATGRHVHIFRGPQPLVCDSSHFCPTAAALLFEAGDLWPAVGIVDAPPALTGVGPLDGLDARSVWPPLLRPGVLMDLESYDAWERLGVELLMREGVAPDVSLDALASTTNRITAWSPGGPAPLLHAVRDAFGMLSPPPTAVLDVDRSALKRWLAARLFGNWIAYQGNGLQAIVGPPARLPRHLHHRARAGWQPARSHPPERSPDRPQIMSVLNRFSGTCESTRGPTTARRPVRARPGSWCCSGCWRASSAR